MSKIERLLELAVLTRQVEGEFVAGLTPQEQQATGAPDDWAAKDLIAHVTTWRERGAEELEALQRGPLPPEAQEFDETNRAIFEENRDRTWEAVIERAESSWAVFLERMNRLTEDLLDRDPSAAPTGRPLWRRISVDAGNHPVLHYAEFARRRGRVAEATRWMEALSPRLLAVDPSDEWRSVVHYNLACHYAQSGMLEKAFAPLRRSLELNPGLRDWSRQDSDLEPLRLMAEFKTIVESG